MYYVYDKVVVAGTSLDHLKCKLCTVGAAKGFLVAKWQVQQIKIRPKSCFATS